MADTKVPTSNGHGSKPQASSTPIQSRPKTPSKNQQLNKLYTLPAPLRTFPLPTFVPHNPISLFHLLFAWVSQTIWPQATHLEPLYQGWFSPETRSVHVTDVRSIRGLWEQGFYGKGSLSRSEPEWLELQKARAGVSKTKKQAQTAWEWTNMRRAKRKEMKWERARAEREAIEQKLLEEARAVDNEEIESNSASDSTITDAVVPKHIEAHEELVLHPGLQLLAPVGPLELLRLPNSGADLAKLSSSVDPNSVLCFSEDFDQKFVERFYKPPVGPLELLALPNSIRDYPPSIPARQDLERTSLSRRELPANEQAVPNVSPTLAHPAYLDGFGTGDKRGLSMFEKPEETETIGGSDTNEDTVDESVQSTHSEDTVETQDTQDTPLNGSALANGGPSTPKIKRQKSVRFSPTVEKTTFLQSEPPSPEKAASETTTVEEELQAIQDKEYVQLTFEEAFFLSYALGALTVLDPVKKTPITNQDLFSLFRKSSYFPPLANPSLSPDDPFMINYVVFHHFRSLGWVVRSGIKFSVDYLLYVRGPVFTHAEFAILVLPSYSDPYWNSSPFLQNYVRSKETRTWPWMSRIHRVIVQAKKTLILCYVDIPKPLDPQEELKLGFETVLKRYKVREIVLKRFSANRLRD